MVELLVGGIVDSGVAVVTDSTGDLPADWVVKYGLRVVPLQVTIDGEVGAEGLDVAPADVIAALAAGRSVTTSQPSPQTFLQAYRNAAAAGARAIVSVHISSELSGTVSAARLAAAQVPTVDVRVVDSRSVAMGLGFAAVAAAEVAAAGASVEEVERAAAAAAGRSSVLFYVDTLEYLHRGGRIGAAASLLGTALAMKPLLQVRNGAVAPLARVRTAGKARARLLDLASDAAGSGGVSIAVEHLAAPDHAARAAADLQSRLPDAEVVQVMEGGAVVGVHTGPGTLIVAVSPR